MSSLVGSQVPRVRHVPDFRWTDGDDACALGTAYGLTPDVWQADVIRVWFAVDSKGRLRCGRVGLSVPRQNGKNGILEVVELFKMVVQGRKILHTAHEVKTARKAFMRLASFFENERKYPELVALVSEIRRTNGQEAIVLTNGGSCEFVARSRGSGRGFTVDDLVCDEAQELTDEQLEALLPTISAAPSGDPQQLYTGTPPGPASPGDVFQRVREAGVLGVDKRLSWHEWSVPDELPLGEGVRSWRSLAFETNPTLGARLNIQTVKDELGAMSPEGFCRERLGKWDLAGSGAKAIRFPLWRRLTVDSSDAPREGRTAYAVRFSVDGQTAGLAVARRPDTGPIHVEGIQVFDMAEGIGPIVDFLVERSRTATHIAIDGKAGADLLIQALRDAGVKNKRLIVKMTPDLVTSSCAELLQALTDMSLSHIGQPLLNRQVEIAVPRKIGNYGGFGWGAPAGEDVSLLEAATYAFAMVKNTKRRVGMTELVGGGLV